MQIHRFTKSMLDYLEVMCNFTDEELTLFKLRSKKKSLEECAEIMHRSVDSVKALSRNVNDKIEAEL